MRTNIVIDDDLMSRALKLSGLKTKKATVELGLRMLIRLADQSQLKTLRGQVRWIGDLDELRTDL